MSDTIVYRFEKGMLQVGDIMLSTHQTSIKSAIIRKSTGSDYSHASICHDPPEFLEAISKGVCRFNADKFFFRRQEHVRILRPKVGLAPNTLRAAVDEALRHLGNPYWTQGAIASITPWDFHTEQSAVFCSHLVSLAYQYAGIQLLDGTSADKTVPGDLQRSAQLVDVTADVLEPIALDIAQFWLVPYGEGHAISPHQLEIFKSQKVRDQVNRWLRGRGYQEQTNFFGLLNALRDEVSPEHRSDMDAEFTRALESTGYLGLLDEQYPDDHESFRLSRQLRAGLAQGVFDAVTREYLLGNYRERLASLQKALADQTTLERWYENAWEFRRLETFRLLAMNQAKALQINRRMQEEVRACIALLQ